MAARFLRIFWDQLFQLRLCGIVLEISRTGPMKDSGKLSPRIGRAHVDRSNCFDPGPRGLDAKQARALAGLNTAPELLFRCQQQVLVQGIGGNGHL